MNDELKLKIRKASLDDDLLRIAELIYKTDPYIYPYWFENLEKCKVELSELLKQAKFIFNINNIYIAIDEDTNIIAGLVCAIDSNAELDFDYTELRNKNDRYNFIIENYLLPLIKEIQTAEYVYISNVCVDEKYRGKQVGNRILKQIIEKYRANLTNTIVLDVTENNAGIVKLYEKLGFFQEEDLYKGFYQSEEKNLKKEDII